MVFNQDEDELNNLNSFSQSLGTLFRQLGGYSIIQIIASFILVFIAVAMLVPVIIQASPSEIFDVFQTSIWTIIITSIVLEIISYIFIIRLIMLLFGAVKQGIPYKGKYRNSALFFILGIILGIALLVVSIFVTNWLLQLIQDIFNDPLFEIEDLEQVPSTDIISVLAPIGREGLSLAGFYFLKQNFDNLSNSMRNGRKVSKGLQLLVIGYLLQILGNLIGLVVDLLSFLGFAGLILTLVGFFKASNGLRNTIWRTDKQVVDLEKSQIDSSPALRTSTQFKVERDEVVATEEKLEEMQLDPTIKDPDIYTEMILEKVNSGKLLMEQNKYEESTENFLIAKELIKKKYELLEHNIPNSVKEINTLREIDSLIEQSKLKRKENENIPQN
ncbi:MAG: DUF973 family protein [Candidatus Thorarchaeota archaeon]